ncbi:hypothetical protein [Sulfitobacter sp.]
MIDMCVANSKDSSLQRKPLKILADFDPMFEVFFVAYKNRDPG